MRFVWFFILVAMVINLFMLLCNIIFDINVYKLYGKQIIKWFAQFLTLILAVYVAICICGLV